MSLIGREHESTRIAELVAAVESGQSRSLVVRGEVGIGKSALLQSAAEQAGKLRVVSLRGVESEVEIAYASLLELTRPLMTVLDSLPPHLRAALRGALALGPPIAVDPLALGVATLSLLAAAADPAPLLVIVDDAHWVDAASAQALLFAARRLGEEGVGMLFGVRDDEQIELDTSGIPELVLSRLDRDGCARLARDALGAEAPPHVVDMLFEQTQGNPLAVVELAESLSDAQREGRAQLERPIRPGRRIERAFRRRIYALSDESRTALVLAAAGDTTDSAIIARAIETAGGRREDLDGAVSAGLLERRGGNIEFAHPLIRNVAYHTASVEDRRSAHRAFGEAVSAQAPDLALWHLAMSASAPDEQVAASLEELSVRASGRGGSHAATRALERAAELSEDGDARARRLLAAAVAAARASDLQHSLVLAGRVLEHTRDQRLRAEAQMLFGTARGYVGSVREAMELLEHEADLVSALDPVLAARMLIQAGMFSEMRAELRRTRELTRRAHELVAGYGDAATFAAVARRRAEARVGGGQRLVPKLLALKAVIDLDADVATAAAVGEALRWLERLKESDQLFGALVHRVRRDTRLAVLPYLLAMHSEVQLARGELGAAFASTAEGVRLGADTRQDTIRAFCLICQARVEAIRGGADAAREHLDEALELTRRTDANSLWLYAGTARGLLELGTGEIPDAISTLQGVAAMATRAGLEEPNVVLWQPDLIEAYARAGRLDEARAELDVLNGRVEATEGVASAAVAARCAGLLAGDDEFEGWFRRAESLHRERPMPFEAARTALCLGERRRRAGRRRDAREPLRRALTVFEELGAKPWSQRARYELQASGARPRAGAANPLAELTSHELLVAIVVAEGASNADASARLFLSVKTIEKHLTSVYRKLGVRSRAQLAGLLAQRGPE